MIALVLCFLVSTASALPQGYNFGSQGDGIFTSDFGVAESGFQSQFGGQYSNLDEPCGPEEMRNTDGRCGIPEVNRKIYVFAAKESPREPIRVPIGAEPEMNIDVVFVKTPEEILGPQAVVAPGPEQKTVVYVLSKRPTIEQQIIEVPDSPQEPEVFFVNYDENDNPTLPGGISLQAALDEASRSQGQFLSQGSTGNKNYV